MENTNTITDNNIYRATGDIHEPAKSKAVIWLSVIILALVLFLVYLYINGMSVYDNTTIEERATIINN